MGSDPAPQGSHDPIVLSHINLWRYKVRAEILNGFQYRIEVFIKLKSIISLFCVFFINWVE